MAPEGRASIGGPDLRRRLLRAVRAEHRKSFVGVGTYWTPPGTHIIEFPVFTQNYTYSASSKEGSGENEEFQFQDKSGVVMTADVGLSYSIQPAEAPGLYTKFRTDASGLLGGQIRNKIRNALNLRASQMAVEDIYGPRRACFYRRSRPTSPATSRRSG